MKKYLTLALAMPLLFACSSDDLMEKENLSNNAFEGIEKVDATFSMDNQAVTRMANNWNIEVNDRFGFAWLTDKYGSETPAITIDGKAYQNHPLNVVNVEGRGKIFKPETSIYVGQYFLYYPYDESTVSVQAINFNSLKEQTLADGLDNWNSLAKTGIIIGDKWTKVTPNGWTDANLKNWDKAGIDNPFKLYSARFSNESALDLTYKNNNPKFDGKKIKGATDIDYTYPENSTIGAVDIYEATVELSGAANSFTYAPDALTKEPMQVGSATEHNGAFWEDKSNIATGYGFNFNSGVITLKPTEEYFTAEENTGWFWFNSLPVTAGDATYDTSVETVLTTSYGKVTVKSTVGECAWVNEKFDASSEYDWIKLDKTANTDDKTTDPMTWTISGHNTFVNQYGNHVGKYDLTVDFSTGVMNGMHIKNDAHLQKALKYYIAAGKTETNVKLNLDADEDGEFKLSKISIALLQTINTPTSYVKVQKGTGTPKIIITQDGQDAIGLADMTEVPTLNKVFSTATDVYLSESYTWTWAGGTDGKTALAIGNYVSSITNEGTLTVNATNVEMDNTTATLANAAGATMNITKVTTVKNGLTNLGTINVGSTENTAAELRAYDAEITNDATSLTAYGVINNYGVVGVTLGTTGQVNNYGYINMMNGNAITLLTSNEISGADFDAGFDASTNKLGTVVLPENNPCAIVSVSNATETGFIKYNWDGGTYATPEGIIKYNTIVVDADIEFTETEEEIQFIEFTGNKTKVVNKSGANKLTKLKGIIVDDNCSIIIEKTNVINCFKDAYLGEGATVYNGGKFLKNGAAFTSGTVVNYLGEWSTDQVVKY